MALSEQGILQRLMSQRDRISAAAWLVVRDAHIAEDIFQNVALKALAKEVAFDSDGALMSWAFITARREGIDWLRRQKNAPVSLDETILELLEAEWASESLGQAEAEARRCATVSANYRPSRASCSRCVTSTANAAKK